MAEVELPVAGKVPSGVQVSVPTSDRWSTRYVFPDCESHVNVTEPFAAVVMAVMIYAMEVFVAFLQAYIFTLLSAIFIGQQYHPEH